MADVVMPQMGESIVEGTLTKWLKGVGDTVELDEPLFEISTDKVDSEVPSPVAGKIEAILVEEGETVEINAIVAKVSGGAGGGAATAAPAEEAAPAPEPEVAPAAAAPAAAPAPAAAESGRSYRASPLVRRLAREKGVDLSRVTGTGQGGRIGKKDLEAHLAGESAPGAAAPAAAPAARAAAPAAAEGGMDLFTAFRPAPESRFGDHYVEPLSPMRRSIAQHMVMTKRFAPHVEMIHEIDCTRIAEVRAKAKNQFLEQNGEKLTFLPFFLKAAASALKAFPAVNASLDGDDVVYHRDINLGIAVALDWGLLVPVIRDADEKNILGLQRAINDLAGRARKKALKPDELQHSTFSISNYGGFNTLLATPAINQPNVALLGLGALKKRPVVVNDAIAIRMMCYSTLTIDHRVVDGALAAMFQNHMTEILENWTEAVV